jgi:hypothetical protein
VSKIIIIIIDNELCCSYDFEFKSVFKILLAKKSLERKFLVKKFFLELSVINDLPQLEMKEENPLISAHSARSAFSAYF